ncbi:hypothetical protein [Chroococcidiopsis thermalis]|jgi:hypothetical protein|uniref:Septum formation initiator n=1 Tax=Chroococcidiopsis thermalis (strain PCC 7203) TaxID=251229 RepID=K9TU11_CHRTP|nr:hypothetical protein [Chroococcidiopsis thermalis]AFY85666.1 hypothetical protein Chro_0109 [Chroococcidiopsis thermalis PCC 7203]PSB40981.1 hypothetical protein C7B80_32075 [Cyanosarcina cf. burmensis CCALA 770]
MNAIQPSRPPLQPQKTRRQERRRKTVQRQQRHPNRTLVLENTAKLFANCAISAITLYGLVQLAPYLWSQQQKSNAINTEVKQIEQRVGHLRQDLNRYFDPRQSHSLMKEQNNLIEPGQRQVYFLDKSR